MKGILIVLALISASQHMFPLHITNETDFTVTIITTRQTGPHGWAGYYDAVTEDSIQLLPRQSRSIGRHPEENLSFSGYVMHPQGALHFEVSSELQRSPVIIRVIDNHVQVLPDTQFGTRYFGIQVVKG